LIREAFKDEIRLAATFTLEIFNQIELMIQKERRKLVNFVKVMRHELILNEIYISWEAGKSQSFLHYFQLD